MLYVLLAATRGVCYVHMRIYLYRSYILMLEMTYTKHPRPLARYDPHCIYRIPAIFIDTDRFIDRNE